MLGGAAPADSAVTERDKAGQSDAYRKRARLSYTYWFPHSKLYAQGPSTSRVRHFEGSLYAQKRAHVGACLCVCDRHLPRVGFHPFACGSAQPSSVHAAKPQCECTSTTSTCKARSSCRSPRTQDVAIVETPPPPTWAGPDANGTNPGQRGGWRWAMDSQKGLGDLRCNMGVSENYGYLILGSL